MSRTFQPPEGMPLSLFENKYARKKDNGEYTTWAERLTDVMEGNWELHEDPEEGGLVEKYLADKKLSVELARNGIIPLAGRHLQHGEPGQNKNKTGEYFTNCSTAMCSFIKFWLLMKGSGVGRSYDSDLAIVNWDYCPDVRVVLSPSHPDFDYSWMESLFEAKDKYPSHQDKYRWFEVEDSAEGWVKVIEILETASFQQTHKDKLFIFDFSKNRAKGEPIKGQQNRPSSGPAPFMNAVTKIMTVKNTGMAPWKQSMWIDHYLADTVALGGIRRSARIATKWWEDSDIFDFINIKRSGNLFTANNSVAVDDVFWAQCQDPRTHAYRVLNAIMGAQYLDCTGEPAILNLHNMSWDSTGSQYITPKTLLSQAMRKKMDVHPKTMGMIEALLKVTKTKKYPFLVNPCGEIVLSMWGGYCIIGEVNLSRTENIEEAKSAVRLLTQSLIRVNKMRFLYEGEVKRTNRIGVGLTGIHEFAYKFFGASVKDLVQNPDHEFWGVLATLRDVAVAESVEYAKYLGVKAPHTVCTIKPSGTISKVLNVTEAAHPPAFDYYLRWVQLNEADPQLESLRQRGYPTKDVSAHYKSTHIVGFPTKQPIVDLAEDNLVLAGDLTLQEHYTWVMLLEKHWLGPKGNQVSYTVKYDPNKVDWEEYSNSTLNYLQKVRCCSVMPQEDTSKYPYLPEQRISKEEYYRLMDTINSVDKEVYDNDALACASGACPIEPDINI